MGLLHVTTPPALPDCFEANLLHRLTTAAVWHCELLKDKDGLVWLNK